MALLPEAATSVRDRKATTPSSEAAGRPDYGLRRLVPLAVVVLVGIAVYALGWHRAVSLENLVRHHAALTLLADRHILLAIGAYIALYVAGVALSLPCGAILTVAGGILFGGLVGGLAAIAGATLGATCLFLIARSAFGEFLTRRAGPRLAGLVAGFREDAFSYLLFLRLVPVFPFFLVNLAPAIVGVRLAPFVAATALGIIPATFAFAFLGAGLDDVIDDQAEALRTCEAAGRTDCQIDFSLVSALTPQMIAGLVALGLVALIPVAVKRLQARKHRS
jgi:uncharacterized membrane protein YdjX (TVP38/TMEM64 family)